MRTRILMLLLIVATVAAGAAALAQGEGAVPDPEEDILLAEVLEDRAAGEVLGRQVTFALEVAAEPTCTPSTTLPHIYGFLIDADSDPITGFGTPDPAWDDLGVEARIGIDCSPEGQWVQFADLPFTITQVDDAWRIEIVAPVESLPTPGGVWVAFAQDGSDLWRTPDKPDVGFFSPAYVQWP